MPEPLLCAWCRSASPSFATALPISDRADVAKMYVAAFEEMQTVVLGCAPERALFSQRELDALERFAAMSCSLKPS